MEEYHCSRDKLPFKRINPQKRDYCKDPIQTVTSGYLKEELSGERLVPFQEF